MAAMDREDVAVRAPALATRPVARLASLPAGWLDAERESWFLWIPVAFGAGIALYFALPSEPSLWVVLAPALALTAAYVWVPKGGLAAFALLAALFAALGAGAAKIRTEAVRAPVLARAAGPVAVTGTVERVEPRAKGGTRLTLAVASIAGLAPAATPARVRISLAEKFGAPRAGASVTLNAMLTPPQPPVVPGGYDFALKAWFDGLGAVGYAVSAPKIEPKRGGAWTVAAATESLRQSIGSRISSALPGQSGAIARALVTGERRPISAETNQAYKASGLYHVLSISGLHMAIMAGSLLFASRLAFATIPSVALNFPIKKWAAAFAFAGAFAYMLLSGAAFATVRSAVMIAIIFLAVVFDRPAIALRNVALAALVILALWPESLLDAGFQMSFAAVVALVSVYESLRSLMARWGRTGFGPISRAFGFFLGVAGSTLVAGAAVAPLSLHHFNETQQYALLSNLVAIPVCNFVVMPAALLTLASMPFGLEGGPLWVMGHGVDAMTWVAQWVAGLPDASVRFGATPGWAFASMVLGGLWLALWTTRARFLGLGAVALGLAFVGASPRPDILVGGEGRHVAIRDASGLLQTTPSSRSSFDLQRWLLRDGDGRKPAEAAAGTAFHCDGVGCVATVKGMTVALPKHPAAMRDDCAKAAIVVMRAPRPRGCDEPAAVIDVFALKAFGAHALFIDGAGMVRIETARSLSYLRPWSGVPSWAVNRGTGTVRRAGSGPPQARAPEAATRNQGAAAPEASHDDEGDAFDPGETESGSRAQ